MPSGFLLYDIHLFERVLRTLAKNIGLWIHKIYFHIYIKEQRGREYVDRGWFFPNWDGKNINLHCIFKTWPTRIFHLPSLPHYLIYLHFSVKMIFMLKIQKYSSKSRSLFKNIFAKKLLSLDNTFWTHGDSLPRPGYPCSV